MLGGSAVSVRGVPGTSASDPPGACSQPLPLCPALFPVIIGSPLISRRQVAPPCFLINFNT